MHTVNHPNQLSRNSTHFWCIEANEAHILISSL